MNLYKTKYKKNEIEILVEVYDEPSKIIEKLDNFEFKGVKETIDVYYYDPKRDNLKPNKDMQIDECLCIRTKNIILHIKLINLMKMVNGYTLMNMKLNLMIYLC